MTTTTLLDSLNALIAQHRFLSADDPLIVARDGILLLQTDDSEFTRFCVMEFALCVLLINRPVEVAA